MIMFGTILLVKDIRGSHVIIEGLKSDYVKRITIRERTTWSFKYIIELMLIAINFLGRINVRKKSFCKKKPTGLESLDLIYFFYYRFDNVRTMCVNYFPRCEQK